jgi:hypothetical protein
MRDDRMMRSGPAAVCVGVGATVVMDASMVAASHLAPTVLATEKLDVNLIGRWIGGLGRGPRRGEDITAAPAVRGEVVLGLATHYLTGIALTQMYFSLLDRLGLEPGPVKATAFGLATGVLPLMVMFPSMGYGFWGRHSDDARRMNSVMLLGHTAFGAGIGLWTVAAQTRAMCRRGTASRHSG